MVSARPALNHDKRHVPASQVQHSPTKGRHVAQLLPVDPKDEVAGLEPDLCRSGSWPYGIHGEPPSGSGAKAKAQQAFRERVDFARRERFRVDLHRAFRFLPHRRTSTGSPSVGEPSTS